MPQLPYMMFGCIAATCAVLSLFLPETANTPLQDKLTTIVEEPESEQELTTPQLPVADGLSIKEDAIPLAQTLYPS